ncbi:hypothetical protein LCGC14_0181320 [marine sediment metagenome]|uniref:Uncharacterized protein n=1 Tax=marine sediment metagenome TaxID=412755 RepID=A0A0F9UTN2_9ZZZZ
MKQKRFTEEQKAFCLAAGGPGRADEVLGLQVKAAKRDERSGARQLFFHPKGIAGRAYVVRHYSLDAIMDRIEKTYRRLLRQRGLSP